MQVLILTAFGGEVTSLLGTFTSLDLVREVINAERKTCECTEENGYSLSDAVVDEDDARVTYFYVYETGEDPQERFEVMYKVIATNLNCRDDSNLQPIEL